MIPVVAHVFGVGATRFASDVRIANPSTSAVTATLIFTRSGEDGRTSFSAIDAMLAPRQTLAFDDVVDSAFHTVGSGSLEVLGDVVVMSRTYAETAAGTLGQQVPPADESTAIGETPLVLASLPDTRSRYNIGITEIGGAAGVVRVGTRHYELQPFSHLQFPADNRFYEVSVTGGDARVVAYVSQVNELGDAMFIPGEHRRPERAVRIAPAISNGGWRTDLWFREGQSAIVFPDALRQYAGVDFGALTVVTKPNELAATRVRHGRTDQFVPLVDPAGASEQHLVFIESIAPYRTNIGVVTETFALAEVIVYDAAGREVQRTFLSTFNGIAQTVVAPGIASGRAVVRFLVGTGRAYASLVDDRTGDATYVQAK
jgi:hypothetical protein